MSSEINQIMLYAFSSYALNSQKVTAQDIYLPSVLRSIIAIGKKEFKLEDVAASFHAYYDRQLPDIIIRGVLLRLRKLEVLDMVNEVIYHLIGDKELFKEELTESERIVSGFFKEFHTFLAAENYTDFKHATTIKKFRRYCEANALRIIDQIHYKSAAKGFKNDILENTQDDPRFVPLVEKFIYEKVKVTKELYRGFELIFDGVILLNLMEAMSNHSEEKKAYEKILYLDTNIVLRVLAYQNDDLNKLGKEFYDLAVQEKCSLKLSSYTYIELQSLIRGYRYAYPTLLTSRGISHLYQKMRDLNIAIDDIEDFILATKEKLAKLQIEIDTDSKIDADLLYLIEEHKPRMAALKKERVAADSETYLLDLKFINQSEHDLRMLLLIFSLRRQQYFDDFNDIRHFFVTADGTTLRYNRKIHNYQPGIQEAIGDLLISYLFFVNERDNVTGFGTRNFMVTHFKQFELSLSNWLSYVDSAVALHKQGKITKKALGFALTKASLTNKRIEEENIADIVGEAARELNEFESSMAGKESELAKKNKENEALGEQVMHLKDITANHTEQLSSFEQELAKVKKENEELQAHLKHKKGQLRILRNVFHGILGVTTIVSLYFLISNPNFLNSAANFSSIIVNVILLIDRQKKWIIKD
jgi:hypothetical protein